MFLIFKMGYEISFDYVKLSSALVPMIKNDHSLTAFLTNYYCTSPNLLPTNTIYSNQGKILLSALDIHISENKHEMYVPGTVFYSDLELNSLQVFQNY